MTNKGLAIIEAAVLFACLLFMALLLTGCKSQPVVVTEYRDIVTHDTIERERVDSVRVVRYVYVKGDTVHVTDTVEKYRNVWRDRVQIEYKHDSVPYVQEVQVQVPVRTRNAYDRFTSCGFWLLILLALARLAWWAVKKYYLRL